MIRIAKALLIVFVILLSVSCGVEGEKSIPSPSIPEIEKKQNFELNLTQAAGDLFPATSTQTPQVIPGPSLSLAVLQTITPVPTPVPINSGGDPSDYRLKKWTVQDALDLAFLAEQRWDREAAERKGIYQQWGIRYTKRHVAQLFEEVIWHFPDLEDRRAFEVKLIGDWAMAGSERATVRIIALIEDLLAAKSQNALLDFDTWQIPGLSLESLEVPDLFGAGEEGWLVMVTLEDSDWYGSPSGGVILSVRKLEVDQYEVRQVGGDWLPFHNDGLSFQVLQGNDARMPIVLIEQAESTGGGWYLRKRWMCLYQWQDEEWLGLLDNRFGELSSSIGLEIKNKDTCFFFEGFGSIPFANEDLALRYPEIHVEKAIDPHNCDWELNYTFTWHKDRYLPSIELDAITVEGVPYELYCVHSLWPQLEILSNPQELLAIMQSYDTDWPTGDTPLYDGSEIIFSDRFDRAYHDSFRFHLGRLYALSGDVDRAQRILTELVTSPSSVEELGSAQQYLEDLPYVAGAESHYQMNIKVSQNGDEPSPDDLLEIYSARLFDGDEVDGVIADLEGLLADPDLAIGDPDDDGRAGLWYFLGLAHEVKGEDSKAIEAYLHVLRSFPNGVYAQAVMSKLVWQ